MAATPKQFSVKKITDAYWRITFNNPPINLVNPETILELQELVGRIEADNNLQEVVFDSAHPDFYVARYDMSRVAETPVQGWARASLSRHAGAIGSIGSPSASATPAGRRSCSRATSRKNGKPEASWNRPSHRSAASIRL
jgi:enoyl-CoA hydratase/carnithine racemase